MRSDMDHTVLPANYTMPAFTPQPQSSTALWLVLIYRPTESRMLSQPDGWLFTHRNKVPPVTILKAALYSRTRRTAYLVKLRFICPRSCLA